MLNKLNTKERNIVFIVAIILSFLLFITFLQGYYSFDTHRLIKNGYTLKEVTLVDQFVYSPHMELTALFVRKTL